MKPRAWLVVFGASLLLLGCGEQPAPSAEQSQTSTTPPAPPPAEALQGENNVATCQLIMGWDPWEPYHYQDVDGAVHGLDVEIVRAAAEQADCSLQFYRDDWTNLLRMLQTGEIDLLSGATMTEERSEYAHFSPAYRGESVQLYVRAGEAEDFVATELRPLLENGFRLGVTLGYVYGEEVSRLQQEYDALFRVASVSEAHIGNLLDRRIDGFLEDPYVAAAAQRRRGWEDEVEMHPIRINVGDIHLALSKAGLDDNTRQRIDQAMRSLLDSGQIEAIRGRYLNQGNTGQ
jgi:polar amino acid transport system substrate-binding protein